MSSACIPFRETGYFSTLICDYLDEKTALGPFYHRFPRIKNFKAQIWEKASSFCKEGRQVLHDSLISQYTRQSPTEATAHNIALLQSDTTFTVTTGHQLNIFTGPVYFLYKIVSAINLCKQLKDTYPDNDFVPIYWMATEDHDFDEINFFNLHNKKFQWNHISGGPVGELDTEGLGEVFALFSQELGTGERADHLRALFRESYLQHTSLAEATRYLVNQLFGDKGLVIIDGHDPSLKRQFLPYMEEELQKQSSHKYVLATANALKAYSYKVQVNAREINLFYLGRGLRERIVWHEGRYRVHNTGISWTWEEIRGQLQKSPGHFSPNVLLRPLYQEVVLPNLCYIGGGGELAYWLQLKSYFQYVRVPFPILLPRNSVLVVTAKQDKRRKKLGLSYTHLFMQRNAFINRKVREISNIDIDFSPQRKQLAIQFKDLYHLAEETDPTFLNAVKAQEAKQLKGLDKLEKRLLKAQRRVLRDQVMRVTALQDQLFPNQGLQERSLNFSELYLQYGNDLIEKLLQELHPLQLEFLILIGE